MRQLRKATRGEHNEGMAPEGLTPLDEAVRRWIAANPEAITLAFDTYVATGAWPKRRALQRQLARSGCDSLVEDILASMPRLPGQQRLAYSDDFEVPLFVLRQFPPSQPMLDDCLYLVNAAVESYLSPTDNPSLRSDDAQLVDHAPSPEHLVRAGQLLYASYPHPFSGGSYRADWWDYAINDDVVLRFRNTRTLDDYVKQQIELLVDASERQAAFMRPLVAEEGGSSEPQQTKASLFKRFRGWVIGTATTIVGAVAAGIILIVILPSAGPRTETVGQTTHTFSNPADASGQGPAIPALQPVEISCRLRGLPVADQDSWWYRIKTPPWDGRYYASADAFYNSQRRSGSLRNTPLVDTKLRTC